MGLLRFLLAACVIAGHSSPIFGLPLMDPAMAVRTFFIISGFYMTLILSSKYHASNASGYWLFISNRLLRIFPTYYVMLAVSLAFYAAASFKLHAPADRLQYWVEAWRAGHWPALAAIFVSQFTIVGLDITPMFDFTPQAGFGWLTTLGPTAVRAWRFNFLPHAWSISVELLFYFLAPFLCLAKKRTLLMLIGVVALSHLVLWWLLPWTMYFLISSSAPFQFGFLFLGVLSFRCFQSLLQQSAVSRAWVTMAIAPLAILVLFSGNITWPYLSFVALLFGFFAVTPLFCLTRESRLDRFFGDLSYPMYVTHIFGKWLLLAFMGVAKKDSAEVSGSLLLVTTVLLSLPLLWWLEHPIDRWRQARLARQTEPLPAPA